MTNSFFFFPTKATVAIAYSVPRTKNESGDESQESSSTEFLSEVSSSSEALESRIEKAHGILGCLAFAFFFPVGGIIIRRLPGPFTLWIHAIWQIIAWMMALVTLGMGIWMAKGTDYIETYHAIIGIFVIAGISIQPITGFFHHLLFKKVGHRTFWSYAHLFWGIPLITLGAINGGFGLQLNGADRVYCIVYGVFAALIWLIWMLVSVFSQRQRTARSKVSGLREKRSMNSDEQSDKNVRTEASLGDRDEVPMVQR